MKTKYIILDTESNGIEYDAEVWQIAWQLTDCHFATLSSDGGYLCPIKRMDSTAMSITGLDRKTLKKLAEPADILYGRLAKALRGCKAIIGHSINMDVARMIHDAKLRCSEDVAAKVEIALKSIPQYDTMAHTMVYVGKKLKKVGCFHGNLVHLTKLAYPSLQDLAQKLGIDGKDIQIHSADGDVELTRRCMATMKSSHRELVKDLIAGKIMNPSTWYGWRPL